MIRYIAHRLLQSLIVIAIMSGVIYGLIGLMPGDPVDIMVSGNPQLTTADADRLRKLYGVDRPIVERYAAWASAAITGDLGYSRAYSRPVFDVIGPRLANTALLMIAAFLTALMIGLPAGIYAATRPNSPVDAAINLGCFVTISVPSFWLALMLILLFAVILGWLPASGLPTARQCQLRRDSPPPDPADHDPRHCRGRHLRALHARGDDRGAEPRLCPHRARQGRARCASSSAMRCATRCCRS